MNSSPNKDQLASAATRVRDLLDEYASTHKAAQDVLQRYGTLLNAAIAKKIERIERKGFFPQEMWEDGPLFGLTDLCDASAQFSILLRGWPSLEEFRRSMQKAALQEPQDDVDLVNRLKKK